MSKPTVLQTLRANPEPAGEIYAHPPADADYVFCPAVVDGDTLAVSNIEGQFAVRLAGIDAPELDTPQPLLREIARDAQIFLTTLAKGFFLYAAMDPMTEAIDRYGRRVLHVWRAPDGLYLNAELVRHGLARVRTDYPTAATPYLRHVEAVARLRAIGIHRHTPPDQALAHLAALLGNTLVPTPPNAT